jgi:hypothetical protein
VRSAGRARVEVAGPVDDGVGARLEAAVADGSVHWHGFVPNDRIGELLAGASVGLSLPHDDPNYRVSMPSKVIEYLAHGVPVVATPLPTVRTLIEEEGGGCSSRSTTSPPRSRPSAASSMTRSCGRRSPIRDGKPRPAARGRSRPPARCPCCARGHGERPDGQHAAPAALPPLAQDAPVSVVIPARGAAALLGDCLAAVLPQLRDDDELIIAAGDDATAASARQRAAVEPRIRVVDNPSGTTPAGAQRRDRRRPTPGHRPHRRAGARPTRLPGPCRRAPRDDGSGERGWQAGRTGRGAVRRPSARSPPR